MTAIELRETDDEVVVTTTPARLVFRREHGRWTHALEIRGAGEWMPCASAVESAEGRDELTVASPTYQEVQVVPAARKDQRALMLVGAFGPHHFAATVTITASSPEFQDQVRFVFDVVDRCRSAAAALAASYAIGLRAPRGTDDQGFTWTGPDGKGPTVLLTVGAPFSGPCRLTTTARGGPDIVRVETERTPGQFSQRFVYTWAVSTRRS